MVPSYLPAAQGFPEPVNAPVSVETVPPDSGIDVQDLIAVITEIRKEYPRASGVGAEIAVEGDGYKISECARYRALRDSQQV